MKVEHIGTVYKIGDVELKINIREHIDFNELGIKRFPSKSTDYTTTITNTTKNKSCNVRATIVQLEPFEQEAIGQILSEIVMRYNKKGYFESHDNTELLEVLDNDWVQELRAFQKATNTGYSFV